jgi:hypothetical protein
VLCELVIGRESDWVAVQLVITRSDYVYLVCALARCKGSTGRRGRNRMASSERISWLYNYVRNKRPTSTQEQQRHKGVPLDVPRRLSINKTIAVDSIARVDNEQVDASLLRLLLHPCHKRVQVYRRLYQPRLLQVGKSLPPQSPE